MGCRVVLSGAAIFPVVGYVSDTLVQRLTQGSVQFANDIVKAGRDAKKITRAYLKNTPKDKRSAQDLGEWLTDPEIDLSLLQKGKLTNQAVKIAKQRRKELQALGSDRSRGRNLRAGPETGSA